MRRPLVVSALLAVFGSHAATAQVVWQNDWMSPAAPTLYQNYGDPPTLFGPVVFSPDGEVLVRTPATGQLNDEFVRLAANGSVRWRVNVGNVDTSSNDNTGQAMLADSDGSAVVATQYGAAVAKLDAFGRPLWALAVPAQKLVATTSGQIVASACNVLSAIDQNSGQIAWQFVFPSPVCAGNGVAAAEDGGVFATFKVPSATGNTTLIETDHFDAYGHVIWSVRQAVTSNDDFGVVGASPQNVYLSDGSNTRALSAQDGSPLWTATGWKFVGLTGASPEPVLSGFQGTERVAEADGAVRWLQASVSGSSLLPVGTDKFVLSGSLIESSSGNIDWTVPGPATDAAGLSVPYFAFGVLSDGSILGAAGRAQSPAPIVLQRFDAASGAPLNQLALGTSPQALAISASAFDATRVVSVGTFAGANGSQVRVRAVSRDDGSTLWETNDESLDTHVFLPAPLVTLAGDAADVAVGTYSGVWIASYDIATGARHWTQTFDGAYSIYEWSYVSAPLADADGNLILSLTLPAICPGTTNPGCNQLTVAKLDHADGHVVWRRDDVLSADYLAQNIFLVGSDVLVNGSFAAPDQATVLMKLAGADGSVQWRSSDPNVSYVTNVFVAPDGNILIGSGASAEVSLQDGTTLWHNSDNNPTCGPFSLAQLPNGDMIGASYTGSPSGPSQPCIERYPAVPGATPTVWTLDSADTFLRVRAGLPLVDAAGHFWIRLRRVLGTLNLPTFAEFDPQSGTLLGEQVLSLYSIEDPMTAWLDPVPLEAPSTDRALALTYASAPSIAETMGDATIDLAPTAHGDLALQVSVDRSVATAGDVLGFHATVSYTGDAPVSGVKLMLASPWKTHATNIACATLSAANCATQSAAADFIATFDLQPGGQVNISGQLPALDIRKAGTFGAVVAGPRGLVETNVLNNFAKAVVQADEVFANGFE